MEAAESCMHSSSPGGKRAFFLTFKAAYVRHTIDHEGIATSVFGFATLVLLPIFLYTERTKLMKWVAGTTAAILIFVAMPLSLPLDLPLLVRYPVMLFNNVYDFALRVGPCISYLGGHSTYLSDYQKRMAEIREKNVLPQIKGSVDIYPALSDVLIAYDFDYKPRPVFQSYLAYRQPLAQINVDHIKSGRAANTLVIQEMKDLYGYYPMLYDGPSWPEILTRYEPQSIHTGGLILSKREKPLTFHLQKIDEKTVSVGEVLKLNSKQGKILFAKVNIQMTPIGSIQKLFFRVYPPKIEVATRTGTKGQFIAPSEIMKSGFIVSPFAQTPAEVKKLFSGAELANNADNEVTEFKLIETKNDFPWKVFSEQYTFETYSVDLSSSTTSP